MQRKISIMTHMQKNEIIVTGLNGLIGTRMNECLGHEFDFINMSRETGVDITNPVEVNTFIESSGSPIILHLAAKTDVDGCEDDKLLGEEGEAWQINVEGTRNIIDAARNTGKRVIYISTDMVFDGSKEAFTEEDEPDPLNWYARTKLEGEEIISASNLEYAIIRISYPYCASNRTRKDFVHKIIERFYKKEPVFAVTDQVFVPTHIDDISQALKIFLSRSISGIFHAVGSESISAFDAVKIIAETLNFDQKLIRKTTRNEFYKNRAFRPFKLVLKNDKISKFDITMRSFHEGLQTITIPH